MDFKCKHHQLEAFLEDISSILGRLCGEEKSFRSISGQILRYVANPNIAESDGNWARINYNMRLQRDCLLKMAAEVARLYSQLKQNLPEDTACIRCHPQISVPSVPQKKDQDSLTNIEYVTYLLGNYDRYSNGLRNCLRCMAQFVSNNRNQSRLKVET